MWKIWCIFLLAANTIAIADDAQKVVRLSQSMQDLVRQHAVKSFNDGEYVQNAGIQYRYIDEVITHFDVKGDMHTFDIIFLETSCAKEEVSHEELIKNGLLNCPQRGSIPTRVKCDNVKILWRQNEDYKNVFPITLCTPFYGQIEIQSSSEENANRITSGERRHIILWRAFEKWRHAHAVEYDTKEEHLRRFATFKKNVAKIKELQKYEKGSAKYGVNRFADWTEEEIKSRLLTPTWVRIDYSQNEAEIDENWLSEMPESYDWRNHSAVTPVKNQGICGSCWAFSVTGNIEGQWAIKKGDLISLSEQELVDCDRLDAGCSGGLPSNAYKFSFIFFAINQREIIRMGGLEGESAYPYKGRERSCALVKKDIKVYINDSITIPQNESQMAAWLFKNGPISIGLNANAMMWYFGGISHPWNFFCNPTNIDHGVLIVGYGVDKAKDNEPYWIIKNSWGSWWGEHGYYRLYRGNGVCGVDQMASSAIID